jgi:hypothetical protein
VAVAGFTFSTAGPRIVREYANERSAMMAHVLEALDNGEDIGHYGRLVSCLARITTAARIERDAAASHPISSRDASPHRYSFVSGGRL